jgi:hypothetical protein
VFYIETMARCPRYLELEDELARLRQIAANAGVYTADTGGPNPSHDLDREAGRWLAAHPLATAGQAWRAGWGRAWSIAQPLLRDWDQRWHSQSRQISALRSKLGAALMEISRLGDRG